jgi:hypothetical protein
MAYHMVPVYDGDVFAGNGAYIRTSHRLPAAV